jgi:putative sigma-54 modulation protein
MKVNVHAVNFNVDRKLVGYVQERLDKLEKYYDKVVNSDVFFKFDNKSDKAVELAADSMERLLMRRKEKVRTYS